MKIKTFTTKTVSLVLASLIFLSSCASTTMIQSNPSGAKVYLNGEPVGKTPFAYTDTKILGSTTRVKLVKDGYDEYNTSFSRNEEADVGAIIGGILIWVPLLWTMRYKPNHMYELSPSTDSDQIIDNTHTKVYRKSQLKSHSKADRLRELKQLLDDKIITEKEFKQEKTKILED